MNLCRSMVMPVWNKKTGTFFPIGWELFMNQYDPIFQKVSPSPTDTKKTLTFEKCPKNHDNQGRN